MGKSKLQFEKPQLLHIDYRYNEDFVLDDDDEDIKTVVETAVNASKSEKDRAAKVVLTLKIDTLNGNGPIAFESSIQSIFTWEDELDSEIDKLLNTNAPAILLSYIRPFLTQFTAFSDLPPLVLPLLNFKRDEDDN